MDDQQRDPERDEPAPPTPPGPGPSSSQPYPPPDSDYPPPAGSPYPPPPGHGYPPGPPGHWGAPPPSGPPTGMAVTALVLACVGASFAWVPFLGVLGLVIAVAGVVLGLIGRRRALRGEAGGRRMSFWAVVVGAVGVILGAGGLLLSFLVVTAGQTTSGSPPAVAQGADGDVIAMEMTGYLRDQLEAATPVARGETAELGDSAWTVTDVDLDADDVVADLRGYEQQPRGRFVLVKAEVENTGTEALALSGDVSHVLVGGDELEYLGTCHVGPEHSAYSIAPLEPGRTAELWFCYDVAPQAIPGARLLISRFSDRWDPGAAWTLD